MNTRENANQILAQKIVEALFTDGTGRAAQRLAIMFMRYDPSDVIEIGAWYKQSAVEQILKVLNEHR